MNDIQTDLFDPRCDPNWYYSQDESRKKDNEAVLCSYSIAPKLEPHYQMLFCVMPLMFII